MDCEAWGATAEALSKYMNKGKPIFVEGRLKLDQWKDKDGGNRSKLKVVIDSWQFVEGKSSDARTPVGATASADPDDPPF